MWSGNPGSRTLPRAALEGIMGDTRVAGKGRASGFENPASLPRTVLSGLRGSTEAVRKLLAHPHCGLQTQASAGGRGWGRWWGG